MKSGDKVICIVQIDGADQYGMLVRNVPKLDHIYTIEDVINLDGIICLRLVEFNDMWIFKAECFRKVEPQSLTKELALIAMKDKESQKIKIKESESIPI